MEAIGVAATMIGELELCIVSLGIFFWGIASSGVKRAKWIISGSGECDCK